MSGTLLSEEPAELVACWPLGMFVVIWSSGVGVSETLEEVGLDVCVFERTEGVVLGRDVELEVSVAVGGVVWGAAVVLSCVD